MSLKGIKKIVSFHHTDMDGKASGYVIHKFFAEKWGIEDYPQNYIKKNYDEPYNMDIIDKDTLVCITDLSFTTDNYQTLIDIANKAGFVIWVDHHQSSLDALDDHNDEINNCKNLVHLVSVDGCGALLAYSLSMLDMDTIEKCAGCNSLDVRFSSDYFAGKIIYMHPEDWGEEKFVIRDWLYYIDDYDRFKHADPDTKRFILGTSTEDTSLVKKIDLVDHTKIVFNKFWGELSTNNKICKKYIEDGFIVENYTTSQYKRELVKAFEFTLPDGITLLCKNGHGNSFNFVDEFYKYPAVCLFSYDGKSGKWIHSIYARNSGEDFDAAKFCERFGGGGHKGAAGFSTDTPIFTNIELFDKVWKERAGKIGY